MRQVGGNHYQNPDGIEPRQFYEALDADAAAGFYQFSAIKYLSRWKRKGQEPNNGRLSDPARAMEDLDKAIHYIEMLRDLIARQYPEMKG